MSLMLRDYTCGYLHNSREACDVEADGLKGTMNNFNMHLYYL